MNGQDELIKREPAYAWFLLVAAFLLMSLAFGGLGSFGIFLKPVVAEFGWSRGEASMGYAVLSFSAAILGLLWGYFADRWGSRWVTILATLAMPFALFILSRTETLWQFYFAYFFFGGFGFSALFSPVMATVGFWFEKNKGLAIGLVAAGGAVGNSVAAFSARILITDYGWQEAYFILAISYLLIGVPAALVIREAPARIAAKNNAEARNFIDTVYPTGPKETTFWIAIASVFCCICMAIPLVHVAPLISDLGYSPEIAASVLMAVIVAGIPGRIFGGLLGGRIGALKNYIFFSLGQTVLAFLFPQVAGLTTIYILAIGFGLFYSGDMVANIFCLRVMISAEYAGRALGVAVGFGMVGMGLGGYIGGVLFDSTGDYVWSFAVASIAGVVNLLILVLFNMRRKHQISQLALA